jgi:hypothetical protein
MTEVNEAYQGSIRCNNRAEDRQKSNDMSAMVRIVHYYRCTLCRITLLMLKPPPYYRTYNGTYPLLFRNSHPLCGSWIVCNTIKRMV